MRLDFTVSNEPVLIYINAAPDPLEEVFTVAASSAGWDDQKIIQTIIEHAGRD